MSVIDYHNGNAMEKYVITEVIVSLSLLLVYFSFYKVEGRKF